VTGKVKNVPHRYTLHKNGHTNLTH